MGWDRRPDAMPATPAGAPRLPERTGPVHDRPPVMGPSNQAMLRARGEAAEQPALDAAVEGLGAGRSLAPPVRGWLEERMGTDLGAVRIHHAPAAAQLAGARAFTAGNDVVFADAAPGPGTVAHELAHVHQHGGAEAAEPLSIGARGDAVEREADGIAASLIRGEPAARPAQRGDPATVRRDDPGVHEAIDMGRLGLGAGPQLLANPTQATPAPGSKQEAALEVYAGNWMRDFSQIHVPMVLGILAAQPTAQGDAAPASTDEMKVSFTGSRPTTKIGAAGAEGIMLGLLRSIGIQEFGKDVADRLITAQNLGVYVPEHHIDNPMGTRSGDLLVRDAASKELRAARAPGTADAERDKSLGGSAVTGLQVDNPALYAVSPTGMSQHIANSAEWAKGELMASSQAARASPANLPEARMHLGGALHIVEDYFAHSNFIEVAFNRLIVGMLGLRQQNPRDPRINADFLGRIAALKRPTEDWVDTLYGARDPARPSLRPVTTGTFGPVDTKVSVGHLLLPKLPFIRDNYRRGVDELIKAFDQDRATLRARGGLFGKTRSGQSLQALVDAVGKAGVTAVIPTHLGGFGWWGSSYANIEFAETPVDQIAGRLYDFFQELPPENDENAKKAAMRGTFRTQIRNTLNAQVDTLIAGIVTWVTGQAAAGQAATDAALASGAAHEAELTAQTAMSSRLHDKGDLAKLPSEARKLTAGEGDEKDMPPSHSEISKDHPAAASGAPHPMPRSLFHELNRNLAERAVGHIMLQMERVWRHPLLTDELIHAERDVQLTHDGLSKEARARAERVAKKEPRRTLQRDSAEALAKDPELRVALDLIDFFLAHPDASLWWRPIFRAYIAKHLDEVMADIGARNRTRAARRPVQ